MGGEVRVLLLLGLLHWVGGSEGRKTWRRRGQQPPQPPPPPPLPQRAEVEPGAGQPVESFPLDFTAVEGNMDSFMAQVKSLAQSLYPCSAQQLNEDLRLHLLLNTSVTCNDGSPAGYYLKESKGSRRWLLFLEGGWYCFNRENCDSRYSTMRRLMSSKDWPHTRTGTGILSSQPEENPHWWNANMVFIPYCSSDVWSGASPKSDKNEYAFMGSLIIQEVVRELLGKGLSGAKVLLLAGSRCGAWLTQAGSWTTSSTGDQTALILSTVHPQTPSAVASGTGVGWSQSVASASSRKERNGIASLATKYIRLCAVRCSWYSGFSMRPSLPWITCISPDSRFRKASGYTSRIWAENCVVHSRMCRPALPPPACLMRSSYGAIGRTSR
ncbi:palmitoleoyl-protein carboxylesterase NOTUM isoform 2 precursor [Mus musculus]|nr:palmitoleoyl-protein carboxylesterase NOTUM isoform 2 precursor [Mus musculus]